MDKKKLALVIGFVIIVLLLGWGLYYLFFQQPLGAPAPQTPATQAPSGAGAFPTGGAGASGGAAAPGGILPSERLPSASPVAHGGITQTTTLTGNPVLSPHLTGQNIAYYDRATGKFYRIDQNGNATTLSNQTFFDVQNVTWNPQANKAILEYPDGTKTSYDFATQKQTPLPKQWQDFSFNPDGTKLAAKSIGLDPENRYLVVSNPDGTNTQAVVPLGNNENKVQVSWSPNNQVVGFSDTGDPRGFASKEMLLLGLHNENFKSIIVPGLDFHPLWSTAGDKLLFSTYNPDSSYKPELWIVDAQGDTIGNGRQPIKLNTWADKCTFADNNTVYCAVPQTLPDGAGLEPEVANGTPDTLFKIDLTTGAQTPVAIPEQSVTINSLVVPPAKDVLYFTDAASGQLYKIKLK